MNGDNHIVRGVLCGTVCSEPDELGRVEVRYEWMEGETTTARAPIATLMSGGGRGSWFMPEIGDEVLVAFDHGRSDHPFIIGFLWNGASAPPTDDIDRQVRRVQTVTGHVLEFDDHEGDTRVRLASSGGHQLVLDDAGDAGPAVRVTTTGEHIVELHDDEQRVRVATHGGHELELSDAAGHVRLETSGNHKLELSDDGRSASLESSSGNKVVLDDTSGTVRIESAGKVSIEVDSLGKVTVTAPLGVTVNTLKATFSGVLEAQMVRAQLGQFKLVVADAHTPGWGTILP